MTGKKETNRKKQDRFYKTYKVYPLHHMLFYSCLSVCQRDKITDYLMKEFLGEDTKNIPNYSKSELLENMIQQINNKPVTLLYTLHDNKRLKELIQILVSKNFQWDGIRVYLQTYCSCTTHSLISKIATTTQTIGEVIELAIENYLCTVSETHYALIKLAFKTNYQDFYLNLQQNEPLT